MTAQDSRQKVAFLDTNALHFMRLYLDYCKKEKLRPDLSSEIDVSTIEKRLKEDKSDQTLKASIRKGMKTIEWLLSQGLQVEYSPVSELELISGLARGRALQAAAAEGIPDRMWGRVSDDDIQRRVTAEELESIGGRVKELPDELDEIGISKLPPAEYRDVWELSKSLAEIIYLSPNDSVIYASALYVRAEYLITRDAYFKKMANKIRDSEKPRFRGVRKQVQSIVDKISLEGSPVIPPSAVWPAKSKKRSVSHRP